MEKSLTDPKRAAAVAEVNQLIDVINNMNDEELHKFAVDADLKVDKDVNTKWLRKKCKRLAQTQVFKERGIDMSETMEKNDKELDASTEKTEKPKAGRKRMALTGTFKLEVDTEKNQSMGRNGSVKNGICEAIKDIAEFTYPEFEVIVSTVMGWDEDKKVFVNFQTKFENLTKAARAWFSELKNKQKIIVQVSTGETAESTPTE